MPKQTITLEKQDADNYFDRPEQYRHLLTALTTPDRPTRYIGGIHQEYLRELQKTTRQQFDKAIIVIDNSGSTGTMDGKAYYNMDWNSGRFNRRLTTRLNEICQRAIDSLILYRILGLPCVVTALNQEAFKDDGRGGRVSAGRLPTVDMRFDGSERSFQECIGYILAIRKLFTNCCNVTPLTSTLERVMPGEHRDQVGIILNIITDGLPNEGDGQSQDFANRTLTGLINERGMNLKKMNIVLNLATDEQQVVDYYGDMVDSLGHNVDASRIDMQVQEHRINADTIDDFWSEQTEVTGKNPVLSYPLMLHLIRQAGLVAHTKMDLLDERKLTRKECFGLALDLLSPEDLTLMTAPNVIADMPLVYQPKKQLNHAKEEYYDDLGGVYKPLIDPKALVRSVIAQEPSFGSRQLSKLRLNLLGNFLPNSRTKQQAQQQLGFGVQAIELPSEALVQEREGIAGMATNQNSIFVLASKQEPQRYDAPPPPYSSQYPFEPRDEAQGYTPSRFG